MNHLLELDSIHLQQVPGMEQCYMVALLRMLLHSSVFRLCFDNKEEDDQHEANCTCSLEAFKQYASALQHLPQVRTDRSYHDVRDITQAVVLCGKQQVQSHLSLPLEAARTACNCLFDILERYCQKMIGHREVGRQGDWFDMYVGIPGGVETCFKHQYLFTNKRMGQVHTTPTYTCTQCKRESVGNADSQYTKTVFLPDQITSTPVHLESIISSTALDVLKACSEPKCSPCRTHVSSYDAACFDTANAIILENELNKNTIRQRMLTGNIGNATCIPPFLVGGDEACEIFEPTNELNELTKQIENANDVIRVEQTFNAEHPNCVTRKYIPHKLSERTIYESSFVVFRIQRSKYAIHLEHSVAMPQAIDIPTTIMLPVALCNDELINQVFILSSVMYFKNNHYRTEMFSYTPDGKRWQSVMCDSVSNKMILWRNSSNTLNVHGEDGDLLASAILYERQDCQYSPLTTFLGPEVSTCRHCRKLQWIVERNDTVSANV
jgi:hypothetical protein